MPSTDSHRAEGLKKTINVPEVGNYATRTNTIILVDYDNNAVFVERTLAHERFSIKGECQRFKFKFDESDHNDDNTKSIP